MVVRFFWFLIPVLKSVTGHNFFFVISLHDEEVSTDTGTAVWVYMMTMMMMIMMMPLGRKNRFSLT